MKSTHNVILNDDQKPDQLKIFQYKAHCNNTIREPQPIYEEL